MRFRRTGWMVMIGVTLVGAAALWSSRPVELSPEQEGSPPRTEEVDRSGLITPGVAQEPPIVIRDAHLDLVHAVRLEVPEVPPESSAAGSIPPPKEDGIDPLPEPEPPRVPEVPDTESDTPAPVKEGPLLSPVLLQAAWISYPGAALKKKVEGPVEVRVRVEEDGGVSAVEIVSASPDTSLNRAAVESAMSMKFKPAMQSGRAVAVWYNYRFDFKLPRS